MKKKHRILASQLCHGLLHRNGALAFLYSPLAPLHMAVPLYVRQKGAAIPQVYCLVG